MSDRIQPREAGRVTEAAHAKINIILHILAREASGYHGIETLFCRVRLADELVVTRLGQSNVELEVEGPEGSGAFAGRRFGFHCSCHQRPLGMGSEAMAWVRKHGGEIELIETGTCCGMAGTFGLKHGPLGYDLANAVGDPLFKAFKESGVEAVVTESSVCAIHLREGTAMRVVHPLELVGGGA